MCGQTDGLVVRNASKSDNRSLGTVEGIAIRSYDGGVNVWYALHGAKQGVAKRIILESREVYKLGEDELWLLPDLGYFVLGCGEFLRDLVVGDAGVAYRVGENLRGCRNG